MKTRVVWTAVAGALLSLTVGCASGTQSARAEEPAPTTTAEAPATRPRGMAMDGQMDARMCPMRVPDTQVSVSETPEGVALTFTTQDEGSVEELRQRLRRMAEMHDRHHGPAAEGVGGGMAGHGMHRGQGGAGMQGRMRMIPSMANFEEAEGGGRLVLTPADPAQLEELRAQVRQHAERMRQGGCPMMMMGMGGASDMEGMTDEHSGHHPQEGQ